MWKLKRHAKDNHTDSCFFCDMREFMSKYKMKIRSHKSSCHVCQKEEKRQYLIHKHIATEHTGDWNFPTKCEECDFVGRYERSLQWHMDQASDIKKYILKAGAEQCQAQVKSY